MLNWPRVSNVATTKSIPVILFAVCPLPLDFFPFSCLRHVFWVHVMLVLDLLWGSGGMKHATGHVMFGEVISIKHGRLHATWHVMFGEVISVKHGRLRATLQCYGW
jgi:hypothetical protein